MFKKQFILLQVSKECTLSLLPVFTVEDWFLFCVCIIKMSLQLMRLIFHSEEFLCLLSSCLLYCSQNPKDCSKAKKLVCNINKGCGYGCQLHHVVYCFMIAYGTQRTLILESQNWRYATGGWETVFRPVSETCNDRSGSTTGHWSGKSR